MQTFRGRKPLFNCVGLELFYRVEFEYDTLLWSHKQERAINNPLVTVIYPKCLWKGSPCNRQSVNAHTVNEYVNSYLDLSLARQNQCLFFLVLNVASALITVLPLV